MDVLFPFKFLIKNVIDCIYDCRNKWNNKCNRDQIGDNFYELNYSAPLIKIE